jgi:hypothetical protein
MGLIDWDDMGNTSVGVNGYRSIGSADGSYREK